MDRHRAGHRDGAGCDGSGAVPGPEVDEPVAAGGRHPGPQQRYPRGLHEALCCAHFGPSHPDDVWAAYLHPDRWPSWAPHLTGVETADAVIRPGTTPDEARVRIAAAQAAAGLVYVANLARLRAHPENA